MFLKKISSLILIFFICSNTIFSGTNNNLHELIKQAVEVSPQIKMLRAKLEAAKNKIPQNSNLPDPQIKLGLVNLPVNSFSFTQEPMTGKMVSITQGIPFPGKLSTNEDVNSVDPEIVLQMIDEEKNKLQMNVETAYWDYQYYSTALNIFRNKIILFESIRDVVQTKYEVSQAGMQNILSVDLSISDIEEKIKELEAAKNVAYQKLQTLVLSEGIIIQDESFNTINNPALDYALVEETMLEHNPKLKQAELLIQKAVLTEKAASYEFYPDFNLTLQYNQRDNIKKTGTDLNDFFSVIVGFNLPINYGGKKSAKVNEANSFKEYYKQQRSAIILQLKIEAQTITEKLNSLSEREQIVTESKMIQAEETFNASLSNYQVGKIDFINVVKSVNDLLKIEIDLYKIRKEYLQEKARLTFLAGTEFWSSK